MTRCPLLYVYKKIEQKHYNILVLAFEYIQLHLMFFIIVKYLPALPLVEVETTNLEIPFGYSLVLERRKNGNENRYITMQYLGRYFLRIVLPLALSEPEPTLPFGLSLSEPTYQHLPTFLGLLNINFTEKLPKIIFFNV